jgi:hypothetical protein
MANAPSVCECNDPQCYQMAKLGIFHISGRSGTRYQFDAYPVNTVWTPVSGIYIITHRDTRERGAAEHICLKLGQLQNLQQLSDTEVEWDGHRANCICLLEERSEKRRSQIVEDIAEAHPFPA